MADVIRTGKYRISPPVIKLSKLASKEREGGKDLSEGRLDEALIKMPRRDWKNKEDLMSATHDSYLSQLTRYARKIL